jgi:hypothetical protein
VLSCTECDDIATIPRNIPGAPKYYVIIRHAALRFKLGFEVRTPPDWTLHDLKGIGSNAWLKASVSMYPEAVTALRSRVAIVRPSPFGISFIRDHGRIMNLIDEFVSFLRDSGRDTVINRP